jgi:NAD(P)-dependent dehydrogenase (short-subunit alcohol dehydrogenase family)
VALGLEDAVVAGSGGATMTSPDPNVAGRLDGRVALVTGAARGIGAATARALAGAGAAIAAVDLLNDVEAFAASLRGEGHQAHAIVADLVDTEACTRAVGEALERFGQLDILVNSACVVRLAPAESLSDDDWDLTMNVNLRAPFMLARAAFGALSRSRAARIVNISSQAAVVGIDAHAAYCTSKAGIVGLTKVLAIEWAKHGITCNAVGPTVVLTELGKQAWAGEKGEEMKTKIPVGRFATPEEIAASVVFLASDAAAMINGHLLIVDGGFTAQ